MRSAGHGGKGAGVGVVMGGVSAVPPAMVSRRGGGFPVRVEGGGEVKQCGAS